MNFYIRNKMFKMFKNLFKSDSGFNSWCDLFAQGYKPVEFDPNEAIREAFKEVGEAIGEEAEKYREKEKSRNKAR